MIVATPYFGDADGRYRPLFDRWIEAFRQVKTGAKLLVLTDELGPITGWPTLRIAIRRLAEVVRPNEPFDLKGALVCHALVEFAGEAILMLDNDALLRRDPVRALTWAADVPLAMPRDSGAANINTPYLVPPYRHIAKRSAGIIYFGASQPARRAAIIADYCRAWHELLPLHTATGRPTPSAEQHELLEQHAWTLVAHRWGMPYLPDAFNWPTHCYGPNPDAIVEHYYGWSKWGRPKHRAVNARLTIPAVLRARALFTAGVNA